MSEKLVRVWWREDGTATCLARVTARDASGAATGVSGEGKWIMQADVSTITCAVYDRNSTTPDTAIATPTVTISSAILDIPVTNGQIWPIDSTGYNFIYDMLPAHFPTGDRTYRVEFKLTTTGGAVAWLLYEGIAESVVTS